VIFQESKLKGVFEVRLEPHCDERGWFARSWCEDEFRQHGLNPRLLQCNVSFNSHKGTLRGIHYQAEPHPEAKLVRCTRGSIFDVAIDLRPESPTFKQWFGTTLSASNRQMLYVPEGCAHGFLTLESDTEVFYQMSEAYYPGLGTGVRWDDPAFGVSWPAAVEVISDRDRTYPDFH